MSAINSIRSQTCTPFFSPGTHKTLTSLHWFTRGCLPSSAHERSQPPMRRRLPLHPLLQWRYASETPCVNLSSHPSSILILW
jgi:hypothetical protein